MEFLFSVSSDVPDFSFYSLRYNKNFHEIIKKNQLVLFLVYQQI